jgi:hypothetical protein
MSGDVPTFRLIKFKTLLRDMRGPMDATNEVMDDQEELDTYVESCQGKERPSRAVAFPDERVIAVALGARPQGGDSVEIIAVVQETGGFVGVQHHVLYVEHVPHGLATDMITYPQHVIRLRGLGGIVSFRRVPDSIGASLHALTGTMAGQHTHAGPSHGAGIPGMSATALVGGEATPGYGGRRGSFG